MSGERLDLVSSLDDNAPAEVAAAEEMKWQALLGKKLKTTPLQGRRLSGAKNGRF